MDMLLAEGKLDRVRDLILPKTSEARLRISWLVTGCKARSARLVLVDPTAAELAAGMAVMQAKRLTKSSTKAERLKDFMLNVRVL